MEFPVTVEGLEGHKLSLTAQGLLFSPKLLVDGRPAPKGRKGGQFVLRRNDGTEAIAQTRNAMLGLDPAPQLFVDGKRIHVAEPLKWYQWLWSAAPLLLVFIGGGLGGLCGGLGTIVNARIFRSKMGDVAKFLATAAITLASVIVFFILAVVYTVGVNVVFRGKL